jgi:hypothetical protein
LKQSDYAECRNDWFETKLKRQPKAFSLTAGLDGKTKLLFKTMI